MASLGDLAVRLFGSKRKKIDNEIARIVLRNTYYPPILIVLTNIGTAAAIEKYPQGRHSPRLLAIYAITYTCTEMSDNSILIPYRPNMEFRDDDQRKFYFALFRAYDYCVREFKSDFSRVSKYFAIGETVPFLSALEQWPMGASDRKQNFISQS